MLVAKLVELIKRSDPLQNPTIATFALEGVLDYFSSSLLAKSHPASQKLLNWISEEGGNPVAHLIGHEQLVTARQAALFNGFQAHLLDYDDVHAQVRGHPSAVILSALLSQISASNNQTCHISGQRFLSAYVIGIEVMARLGEAIGTSHYIKGWHNTATLGGIAATAAICYLCETPYIEQAMAMAATQSAGLRLQFGSDTKPLHAGFAAQQAVLAVELCQHGLTANSNFLDENIGFLALYGQGNLTLDLSDWGKAWRIKHPGLWFKNYPYCSANAYVVDAMRAILSQHQIDLKNIERVNVLFSAQGDTALLYDSPQTQAQGRFSAEYVIACLLQNKTLDETMFQTIEIDSLTKSLMKKVVRKQSQFAHPRFVEIEVKLTHGHTVSAQVTDPKGSPHNPYSQQEQLDKLVLAISSHQKANQFATALLHLNSIQPAYQTLAILQQITRV